jgi:uncharacterized membrane protein YhaH (DUF805 family)
MSDLKSLLFSFDGRLNRSRFWAAGFVLLFSALGAGMLLMLVAKLLGSGPVSFSLDGDDLFRLADPTFYRATIDALKASDLTARTTLLPLLYRVVVTPIVVWGCAAITVRRLHDRNRSGWWLIPFLVVPGLFDQFESRLGISLPVLVLATVVAMLGIWAFVELVILKGTTGANRFGPDPLVEVDTRPPWDQQSEIEFVPHRTGPPPEGHGKREA